MLNALLLAGLIVGVQLPSSVLHIGTYYTYEQFGGNPLYCSRPSNPLYYELDTASWVAVNVRLYQTGKVQCGDWFLLRFASGQERLVQALDAGLFDGYYVEDYPELPIIDIPQHLVPFDGLSEPVFVLNLSAKERS